MLVIMADQSSGKYRLKTAAILEAVRSQLHTSIPNTQGRRYEEHKRVVLEPNGKGTQAACMYFVTSWKLLNTRKRGGTSELYSGKSTIGRETPRNFLWSDDPRGREPFSLIFYVPPSRGRAPRNEPQHWFLYQTGMY